MSGLNSSNHDKHLIVIIGSTAVGKTALSIHLAKELGTEIISADSRQFYKELTIGTAKPGSEELNTVKHHFIGNISINDYYNAYKFETEALDTLNNIFSTHKHAVMVGGSGLYINAVCDGIDELPDYDKPLREELENTFKTKGIEELRLQLKKLDPDYYATVDLANPKRLMRAIEVCLQTGKTYSSLRINEAKERDFKTTKIGLNREREELYDIINRRVDMMIERGLVDEARKLYEYRSLNALNTVGYKELFHYFDNKISLEYAIEKIKTNTRRYAKRQLTWFNKDKAINWFHPDETEKIKTFIYNV